MFDASRHNRQRRRHTGAAKPGHPVWMLSLLACMALVTTACGGSDADTPSAGAPSGGSAGSDITIGLVMSGPSNDRGFYQAGAAGLKRAEKEFGVKTLMLENVAPPDGEQAFRNLVAQGADLVIGMGAEFEDAGDAVAPSTPKVQFAVMNARKTLANVSTYQLREAQVAALAAYATALSMPAGTKFGLVAGAEIPPHLLLRDAVKRSLELADNGDGFVSTFTGDFNDTARAREAALAQIRNGAKIVLPWSGSAVDGALQAARDQKVNAISPLIDRCGRDDSVVASAIADPGGLVYRVANEFVSKTYKAGTAQQIGLDSPDIVHVVTCGSVSPAIQSKVDAFKQLLIAGTAPGMPAGV